VRFYWAAWDSRIISLSTSCRHCSTARGVREVLTAWQIQKFVRQFSIRDRFEVFVGVQIHRDDYVKPPSASASLHVEKRYAILDLSNGLVLRE
jgi:hypothetical protein